MVLGEDDPFGCLVWGPGVYSFKSMSTVLGDFEELLDARERPGFKEFLQKSTLEAQEGLDGLPRPGFGRQIGLRDLKNFQALPPCYV